MRHATFCTSKSRNHLHPSRQIQWLAEARRASAIRDRKFRTLNHRESLRAKEPEEAFPIAAGG